MNQYYAVRWGAELWERGENLRISGLQRVHWEKVADPGKACRECFGLTAHNMYVKPLGASKSVLQSDKKRIALLTSKDGWELVPVEYLDPLNQRMRERSLNRRSWNYE